MGFLDDDIIGHFEDNCSKCTALSYRPQDGMFFFKHAFDIVDLVKSRRVAFSLP